MDSRRNHRRTRPAGGQAKVTKGFGSTPEQRKENAKAGGSDTMVLAGERHAAHGFERKL